MIFNYYFYKTICFSLPSYVRDSTDCINKILEIQYLPDGVFLLTLGVMSLYTNISLMRKGLVHSDLSPPLKFLLEMASYVLNYNYLSFSSD